MKVKHIMVVEKLNPLCYHCGNVNVYKQLCIVINKIAFSHANIFKVMSTIYYVHNLNAVVMEDT